MMLYGSHHFRQFLNVYQVHFLTQLGFGLISHSFGPDVEAAAQVRPELMAGGISQVPQIPLPSL